MHESIAYLKPPQREHKSAFPIAHERLFGDMGAVAKEVAIEKSRVKNRPPFNTREQIKSPTPARTGGRPAAFTRDQGIYGLNTEVVRQIPAQPDRRAEPK